MFACILGLKDEELPALREKTATRSPQNEHRATRRHGSTDALGLGYGIGDDLFGNIGNEMINFVVVCAVTAPDTLTLGIVKTETLGARHTRMQ